MGGSKNKRDDKIVGSHSGRRREEKREILKSKGFKVRRRRKAKQKIAAEVADPHSQGI